MRLIFIAVYTPTQVTSKKTTPVTAVLLLGISTCFVSHNLRFNFSVCEWVTSILLHMKQVYIWTYYTEIYAHSIWF